jgi:hypothetical protein
MTEHAAAHRDRALICAGRPGSLMESFYRWVTAGLGVHVEPVGGHEAVLARFIGPEPDPRVAAGLALGVVDRDAYPDAVLERQRAHVHVLPYYEVESYLCHPALLLPTVQRMGQAVSAEALVDELVASARATYVPAINAHLSNTPRPTGRARLEQMAAQYAGQLAAADATLDSGNVDALLRYFPGRRLADRLSRQLDFMSPQHLLDCAIKHVQIDEVGPLQQLRQDLVARGPA